MFAQQGMHPGAARRFCISMCVGQGVHAMYVGVLNIKHARVRACDVRLIRAVHAVRVHEAAAAGRWTVCKSAYPSAGLVGILGTRALLLPSTVTKPKTKRKSREQWLASKQYRRDKHALFRESA